MSTIPTGHVEAVIGITDSQRSIIVALCRRYGLSETECSLVLHSLRYYGNRKRAAHDLGITKGSVSVYKRRVYLKMGLGTWAAVMNHCFALLQETRE